MSGGPEPWPRLCWWEVRAPEAAGSGRAHPEAARGCSSGACLSLTPGFEWTRSCCPHSGSLSPTDAAPLQAPASRCSCVPGPGRGCAEHLPAAAPGGPACHLRTKQPDFAALALWKSSLGCGGASVGSMRRGRQKGAGAPGWWRTQPGESGRVCEEGAPRPSLGPHRTEPQARSPWPEGQALAEQTRGDIGGWVGGSQSRGPLRDLGAHFCTWGGVSKPHLARWVCAPCS